MNQTPWSHKFLILDLVEELIISNKEDSIEYSEKNTVIPPKYMAKIAKRGLEIREKQPKSNQCCELVGLARGNQLAKREPISLDTLKRMKSFLARHGNQLNAGKTDPESKQAQALMVWGAEPTNASVNRALDWVERAIARLENQK